MGGAGKLLDTGVAKLSPPPSARLQAGACTFWASLKTFVLCEPLSIGHVDVILKLGVLLTQAKLRKERMHAQRPGAAVLALG